MKNKYLKNRIAKIFLASLLAFTVSCERDIDELSDATYSTSGEVFYDTFSSGLEYFAFGNSVPTAFDTDTEVKYSGTTSMKFAVPDYNDPDGSYAGGAFYTTSPRDLSGYNALTFYIKATQSANIGVIGYGVNTADSRYQVSISELPVNTNWKKVIIPIPDPEKLSAETGMFFVSEGPEDNNGYTFWVDDVKFENLGTIAYESASILNGEDQTVTSFVGVNHTVDGLTATYNMTDGTNQAINLTPYYFEFNSSNTSVATIDETGKATVVGAGTSVITATLGGNDTDGSLTINSNGTFIHAPTPTTDADDVISIFSDTYNNVPVSFYNGYWQPYQTTTSADFVVDGDNVLNYNNFNFVGIQTEGTVDASGMSTLHLDLYFPNPLTSPSMAITIKDFGANGADGGGDDITQVYNVTNFTSNNWMSIDIPLSIERTKIGQFIFEGSGIDGYYLDNMYFYNDGSIIPETPTAAAPTPTADAADVLSIFSDAYTDVSGTDFNPYWGQSTQVSQESIAGNNTLKYAGLNYQGTQFASALDVSSYGYIHIDYYTANSTGLNFYLISSGPVETASALSVPSGVGGNADGWQSVDIPLSSFSPVDLANVIQFKVDGDGDIFFDNIYFHN